MKKFDVFQLPDGSYRAIKYGFSWPSLFFTWIWCFFFARLYGWGSVWIGVLIFSGVIDKTLDEPITSASSLPIVIALINFAVVVGFGVWFSLNANEFRRRKYAQMGYSLVRKQIDALNRDNAISIARKGNDETEGSQGHKRSSPAEAVLASAPTPSCETTETSRLKRQLEEWAELSDTKLAVILATNNQQVTKEVMDHLEYSARQGKSQASYLVGEIYRIGMYGGPVRNKSKPKYWLKRAKEMGHPDADKALNKIDAQRGQKEETPVDVDAKNGSALETKNATEIDDGWSEEFQILNEYDPIAKECHDELEAIDSRLSSQFREEVVSDRTKAKKIQKRLKAEHEKKMNPYASEGLNEALAEARHLGSFAEEEFTRVVEVMGEDIDVDDVIQRLQEKYGVLTSPEDMDAQLKHWGIIRKGDNYFSGGFKYTNIDDAIAYAEKKLEEFFDKAEVFELEKVLMSSGYTIETGYSDLFRVISKDGNIATLMAHEFPKYIKAKIAPKEILQHLKYFDWGH